MAIPAASPFGPQTPTRLRYRVLGLACALSMITYLDRACMGSAAKSFVQDLGLTSVGDLNWVFTAFTLAYAAFEIPSGWLGDVLGPRKVLIRIVLWWSAFTALTGLIGMSWDGRILGAFQLGPLAVESLAVLIGVRFLFGMGEAGAYPNITRALHNWFPLAERGFAQGAVWMCGRLMGGLTPLVWMVLVEGVARPFAERTEAAPIEPFLPPLLHWRATFWLFGALGVLWCVVFAISFRNRPEENRGVNQAELNLIRAGLEKGAGTRLPDHGKAARAGVPWRQMLKSGNLGLLCLMYACQSYGWAFYLSLIHI